MCDANYTNYHGWTENYHEGLIMKFESWFSIWARFGWACLQESAIRLRCAMARRGGRARSRTLARGRAIPFRSGRDGKFEISDLKKGQ
jgi:hypothetical protein